MRNRLPKWFDKEKIKEITDLIYSLFFYNLLHVKISGSTLAAAFLTNFSTPSMLSLIFYTTKCLGYNLCKLPFFFFFFIISVLIMIKKSLASLIFCCVNWKGQCEVKNVICAIVY